MLNWITGQLGSAPGLSDSCCFISSDHIEHVALCKEGLFSLCGRDISDGFRQPPVVEPMDPSECGHFQILQFAPRALADQHGLLETVYRFSEAIIETGANAADRWFDTSLGQSLCVSNGQV